MAAACGQQRAYTCTFADHAAGQHGGQPSICGKQYATDLELLTHIRQQHLQPQQQVQQPSPLPRAQSAKSPRVNSKQGAQKQLSNGVAKTPPVGNGQQSAFTAPQPQMMNPLMAGGMPGMVNV